MSGVRFSVSRDTKIKIRNQSDTYNRAYSDWRKANSSLGYYPEGNTYSFTNAYTDGISINKRSELTVYRNTLRFIGKLTIAAAIIVIVFETLIPLFISIISDNLVYDFYSGTLYGKGGETLSFVLSAVCAAFCYGLVLTAGALILKIPGSVTFPLSISSHRMFRTGIAAAAAISAVNICCRKLIGIPEFSFDTSVSGFSSAETIIRLIIYAVILPVLSELAFRGVLLQLLRQFGDVSAVITCAFLSSVTVCAVVNADITGVTGEPFPLYIVMMFPMTFLAAICSGYFTFTSGTIITPIIMSIIYALGNISYILLSELQNDAGVYITSLVGFAAGFIAILSVMREHSYAVELRPNHSLTIGTKVLTAISPEFLLPLLFLIFSCFIPN